VTATIPSAITTSTTTMIRAIAIATVTSNAPRLHG
jgi:hypothetical protein